MKRQILGFLLLLSLAFGISAQDKEARKIEEITDFCCEYTRAAFDNFLVAIKDNPESKGFVIFYDGKNHPICDTKRLPKRAEINLIENILKNHISYRKQDPKRFSLINGGYREVWTAELWMVPSGAHNPKPMPTLKEKEIKFRKGKAKKLDLQCEP